MAQQNQKTETVKRPRHDIRITRQQYEQFEALCPQPAAPRDSSGSSDFRLGVQHVLQLLREGII